MKKQYQLVFQKADFTEYTSILQNEEIRNKVASFLLKYVSIESFYKKLLIAEQEASGKKLSKQQKDHLDVKAGDVRRVLTHFGISGDELLINRIFGNNDTNYMDCSIKKLRNRLVHNVNSNVLRCILERYEDMDSDLNTFMELFV